MATDMHIKVEGIDGEDPDDKHDKWIEVLSFSHGVAQSVSTTSGTGGHTAGRVDFQDFTITKKIDTSTPDLNMHCCNGKHVNKVEFEVCKRVNEEQHVYMKYEMEDVIVSSVSPGGSDGAEVLETVSFAYGKIKWQYTPVDNKGKSGAAVDRTWDIAKNKQA